MKRAQEEFSNQVEFSRELVKEIPRIDQRLIDSIFIINIRNRVIVTSCTLIECYLVFVAEN